MRLDGEIEHPAEHVGRGDLDHGDLGERRLVAELVHRVGRLQHQQARLVDRDPRFGHAFEHHRLLAQRFAERDPGVEAAAHLLERHFSLADRTHAVMDASRTEPALRNLEAAAFAEQYVRDRNLDVLEQNFAVPVGRMVVAEDRQPAHDLDAWRVAGDENHRLLPVPFRILRIGLAHDDKELASPVGSSGGPPFAAVDDIVVALPLDTAFDIGGVG